MTTCTNNNCTTNDLFYPKRVNRSPHPFLVHLIRWLKCIIVIMPCPSSVSPSVVCRLLFNFSTSLLKPLHGMRRTLTGSKIFTASISLKITFSIRTFDSAVIKFRYLLVNLLVSKSIRFEHLITPL